MVYLVHMRWIIFVNIVALILCGNSCESRIAKAKRATKDRQSTILSYVRQIVSKMAVGRVSQLEGLRLDTELSLNEIVEFIRAEEQGDLILNGCGFKAGEFLDGFGKPIRIEFVWNHDVAPSSWTVVMQSFGENGKDEDCQGDDICVIEPVI